MKRLGTKELEETVANLKQLRDRFAAADAGSAVRQLDLTIAEAEAELASRAGRGSGAGGSLAALLAPLWGPLAEFAPLAML